MQLGFQIGMVMTKSKKRIRKSKTNTMEKKTNTENRISSLRETYSTNDIKQAVLYKNYPFLSSPSFS